MQRTYQAAGRVIETAGDFWLYALIALFAALLCESAKPKPTDADGPESRGNLAALVMIASIVTPFLLFWHGFQAAIAETSRPFLIVGLLVAGPIILGALTGWTLGAAMPGFGKVLRRLAPWLNLAAFGLALYAAWPSLAPLFG